jgi:hypothetical protein
MVDQHFRKKIKRAANARAILENHRDKVFSENTALLNESSQNIISEGKKCLGKKDKLKAKRNALNEQFDQIESNLTSLVSKIILESAPIDPVKKEELSKRIFESSSAFISSLFDSGDVNIKFFAENSSEKIKSLVAISLTEGANEAVKSAASIIEEIKKETSEAIKKDIQLAKETEEIKKESTEVTNEELMTGLFDDDLDLDYDGLSEADLWSMQGEDMDIITESASVVDFMLGRKGISSENEVYLNEVGKIGFKKEPVRIVNSTFSTFLRESAKSFIKERGDLISEEVLGNAALQLTAMHTLQKFGFNDTSLLLNRLIV